MRDARANLSGDAALGNARPGGSLMAGVSSFGFSGTNCHVVVAEPPPVLKEGNLNAGTHLLVFSANQRSSLTGLAKATLDYLSKTVNDASPSLASICWAMSSGRAALPHRVAIVADSMVRLLKYAQIICPRLDPFDVNVHY